jgi:DNA-binding response OmpR family regulator
VIAIISSQPRERSAFAALCESRSWASAECDSLRAFRKLLGRVRPRVVLTRHKLVDGYSDDILAALAAGSGRCPAKIVVLLAAGTSSALEARQVALGADCILRDPVRAEVLSEYIFKYYSASSHSTAGQPLHSDKPFRFAGGQVDPVERILSRGSAHLTPREVELSQLLALSQGEVVTYESLYGEILGRKFRGDTSNLRVLLGKLDVTARRVGVVMRNWIEVIPKLGYRYKAAPEKPE